MDTKRKGFIAGTLALSRRTIRTVSGLSSTVAVKQPPFYDISHWIIVNNWAAISPKPLLMGTKATEADNYQDPTFPEYFGKMKTVVGCRRLAYHFFRKTVDPVRQANWFVDYITPYIDNNDVLCLDFEEGGETAPQLWAFLDRVRQRRPNNLVINYSRKNLMDVITMTESEKAFFRTFPSWPAGYPTDPDPYTTTPAGYIPDQTKWGPVWAWQYSDDGVIAGIEGNNVDLNLLEPAFINWLGGAAPEPPPADKVTFPYTGVQRITGRRFDSDIYVTILSTNLVRFQVVHEQPFDNGLFMPSQACQNNSAQFAWNGDEWNKNVPLPAFPKNLAVSNGALYTMRSSAEPSLNIRSDGTAEIIHQNNPYHYNTTTGRRYLMEGGVIKSYLYGSEPQYTERHPRGLTGLNQNRSQVIMITVDGRTSKSRGVTLLQGAEILKEFGAYTAYDRGGGGDAVDVMDGIVQNVPCDTNANGQPGVERAVPQAILAYAEKENDMAYRYTATAKGDGTRLRKGNNTTYDYVNSYPAGTVFDGDNLFVAPVRLSNASGVYQEVGDKWLEVKTVNGQPPKTSSGGAIDYPVWVAVIHKGSTICTLVDHGEPPPEPEPPTDTINIEVNVKIDGYGNVNLMGVAEPEPNQGTGSSSSLEEKDG